MSGKEDDRKQKVDLPDSSSVDLASVQFPRRGEFTLPSGPKVNAVQLNRRHSGHGSEDASQISARTDVPLPEKEMHVAELSTREGGSQLTSREDSEMGQIDPTQATARRRDGSTFPLGDMNGPTVPKVL